MLYSAESLEILYASISIEEELLEAKEQRSKVLFECLKQQTVSTSDLRQRDSLKMGTKTGSQTVLANTCEIARG